MHNTNLKLFPAITFLLLFVLFKCGSAQTILIDPLGDGGFENGTSFAANGWTVSNSANNPWVVGTAISTAPFSGNSAYISNSGGTTHTYTISSKNALNFFYRDVTVPAGESRITLNFDWICNGEAGYDLWQVFIAPTSVVPVGSTSYPGSGTSNVPSIISGAVFIGYGQTQSTAQTASMLIPGYVAGTTFRLIFVWKNDSAAGTNPPAGIDNISMVSVLAHPLVGGNVYPINGNQNPPLSFADITTAYTYLMSDGITGIGQVILELNAGYSGEPGPTTIGPITGASASVGVTIRPAPGYTASTIIAGQASPNRFAIALNGCKYLTLDGRAGGVGVNRDWTIKCTGSTNGESAIRFLNTVGPTNNNTVRYCNLIGEGSVSNSAIVDFTLESSTGLYLNNIIENNLIESGSSLCREAIFIYSSATGQLNTGNIIRFNTIRRFSYAGIEIGGRVPGLEVYNNEIYFTEALPTSIIPTGIKFSSNISASGDPVKIYNNKIYNLLTTTSGAYIRGFHRTSSSATGLAVKFFNNIIALGNGTTTDPYFSPPSDISTSISFKTVLVSFSK